MDKQEVMNIFLDALAEKYGDIDDDCGCYISTDYGHEWLSVREIKDFLIDTINAYDWD